MINLLQSALDAVVDLPSWEGLEELSDDTLLAGQLAWIAAQRRVTAGAARFAAEIARRSARELGHAGMAQKAGARSPEQLVERLAGIGSDEARALVGAGELLASGGSVHTQAVAASIADGSVSILAAQAIRSGLGEPGEGVSAEALADAAELMVTVAPEMTVRRVAQQARALRDSLDAAGVADRERLAYEKRFLRVTAQADGMTRIAGLLDSESAAIVTAAFDQVTSPRRGGPRFVDPAAAERSRRIVDDPRTTEQLLLDAFVELVRIASAADEGRVFVQRRPAVQLHVQVADLDSDTGAAHLEGQTAAVSTSTARRYVCSSGAAPILFDGDRAIDVGRTQRLHTVRQRTVLAARDGGCTAPGCDRPPSWTEVHHPREWSEGGDTSIENGILLCRFHHRWVHEQGWRIRPRGGGYVAVPPPGSRLREFSMVQRNPVPDRAHGDDRVPVPDRAHGDDRALQDDRAPAPDA